VLYRRSLRWRERWRCGVKIKIIIQSAFLAGAALTLAPNVLNAGSLGVAQGFNLFVFNNLTMTSDVDGAVAYGGVLSGQLDAGTKLASNQLTIVADGSNASNKNVLGSGGLTLGGGSGGYVMGYSNASHNNINLNSGTLLSASPIGTIASSQSSFVTLATTMITNGIGSGLSGAIDTTGSSCTVCYENLKSLNTLSSINYKAGQTVIIDITGTGATDTTLASTNYTINGSYPINNESTAASNILFNFGTGTSVTLNGALYGSILAPNATVTGSGLIVDGEIIANNVAGLGETHAGSIFTGNVSQLVAAPEPSTFAMLGGGLVAFSFWKRRRTAK
jgi:choice-of-anchor A domain-containing protein